MNKKTPLTIAILAAGQGKRMQSDLPKVLHEVNGKALIGHVIESARTLNPQRIIAIIGYGRQQVIEYIQNYQIEYVIQEEQLGTGHAVQQVEPLLADQDGHLLVLSGDVPLLRPSTLMRLFKKHINTQSCATILTAILDNPRGYGRIMRKADSTLDSIVEHKDCSEDQLLIKEINAGVYLFQIKFLFEALKAIDNNNIQGEYYLPDVLGYFTRSGEIVSDQIIENPLEISGVNTIEQLIDINNIYRKHYAKSD
jgi:UDP-N-acetylglucosamine diphosphorylase/glucosamine-1-phosphate N-acetyltransferase